MERIFESVPNFSEGRRRDVIEAIAGAAGAAHVLDTDPDPDHHRVVISVAGSRVRLAEGLMDAIGEAIERIDVRTHSGVHPRVGAADVVPLVPLGETTLGECRDLAHEIGERVWAELHVPVYFYGQGEGRSLADIRAGRVRPDLGGPSLHPSAGAVCVGARRTLVAFNVLLPESDLTTARALARALRESEDGMRGVQALVFELPGGRVQLSMNLFRVDETRPSDVLAELERRGVPHGAQQLVGLCPAIAANGAAAGRLLEGRLASAAALAAAERCDRRGDDEHTAVAARLRRESTGLAELGLDQDELLAGAERAAALIAVLRAAQVLDGELEAMLRAAAGGLRAAITEATQAVYRTRVAAVDGRLADAY
jgi:glutamate formiminotransferase / 5-formyltetrahydrofolate cyclo-ligase